MKLRALLLLASLLLPPVNAYSQAAVGQPEVLKWDALVPEDFNPDKLFEKYELDKMKDDDPRADEFLREMKKVWKAAPVVEAMEGRLVKLPGFIVPLETEGDRVSEFFLVPYFGACIHVPPPPANQMVYVVMEKGKSVEVTGDMFEAVWVTGTLHIKGTSNELGDAGYILKATATEPYKEEEGSISVGP
ncbi:MAG: DUF3299 domain-containing protein [Gammaproteobacteria bacterium]|nr:DUF3299 domain-containing protein [Gammaproteobacteria bacterium]MBU1655874.1 DUF3299 domain-containing protein [Gammaproteobacteria bacterium]MBU1960617.1 DUF3299 domain-containing protein [Gammaproteobacteria bacterium]